MSMNMYFEPGSKVFKIAQEPILEQAVTPDGESLALKRAKTDEPRFMDLQNSMLHQIQYELNYQPGVKSLKTFSGKFWVIQEVKSEDWVIETDKAAGATRTVCDLDTLKITGLKLEGNSIMLDIEITSATGDENLMSYNQIPMRMRYEGYETRPAIYHSLNSVTTRSEGRKIVWVCKIATQFPAGFAVMPRKLMIRVPTEVKAAQIPFEFHDLELP